MEKVIETYFRDQAKKHGVLALKFVSPGASGVPDRLVIFPDRNCEFVELKKPGGQLRPVQKVMISKLEDLGQTVTVIDSKEAVDAYWVARRDR